MTVLDLSNYDADTLDVECMKANGVAGVILGCQRPLVAEQMAEMLIAGGLPIIGVYAFLYLGIDSIGQTQVAINVALARGVRRVWLDVESTGANERAGITPAERIAEVSNCVAMVRWAGLEPGIYTGRWYWVPQMGNTTAFSDLPLWHSAYYPDRREERVVAYGGWTNVAIHQYASDIEVCGRVRDHNYVFEEDGAMTDNDILAVFGSTEADPAERLANAKYRYQQAIDTGHSPFDLAAQAQSDTRDHIKNHAAGVTGPVIDHTHVEGKVKRS